MSSINDYLDPPINIKLKFSSPDLTSVNILISGSREALNPYGFSVSKAGTLNQYTIVMPITDTSTETGFAETITNQTAMTKLERQVNNTIIPTLITDWTAAGSSNPVADSSPDIEEETGSAA